MPNLTNFFFACAGGTDLERDEEKYLVWKINSAQLNEIKTAPEILNKENHGFSVDFYALGVILYELVMQKVNSQLLNQLFPTLLLPLAGSM